MIFKLLGMLPLRFLHQLGWALGQLMFLVSPGYAKRLHENYSKSGVITDRQKSKIFIKNNAIENGKALAELPRIWFPPGKNPSELMKKVYGWDLVEKGLARGHGLILLTPHIGCFEIIPHYLSTKFPFTALYRPPKLRFLEALMRRGRQGKHIRLATTDVSGVRVLLKALKRGEAIGVLPDQVPSTGDGEWAEFFQRPAYTMTMWSRLAEISNATVLLMATKRLAKGAGFELSFSDMPELLNGETQSRRLNRGLESLIRKNPNQFLWSYNRYKTPAGISPEKSIPTE